MHMAAIEQKEWTLEELWSLPDDGNKYEVVHGELFVTPAPSPDHETIGAILNELLLPYVKAQRLGRIYRPRSVVRVVPHSEVEPDLMVRTQAVPGASWEMVPLPSLVVEIASRTTLRRDQVQKRKLYVDIGIPDYWIFDPSVRSVHVVRPGRPDTVTSAGLLWHPAGASEPFHLDVAGLFREALGG